MPMKRIWMLAGAVTLAFVLAVMGGLLLRGADEPAARDPVTSARVSSVPAHVLSTLAEIDAGRWPPSDNSGTKGGGPWQNREGRLPRERDGKVIRYQEWDVNVKRAGRSRDAERIVTGSDSSAWYTADHYATFVRVR